MAEEEIWRKRAAVFKPIMDEGVDIYKRSEDKVKTIAGGYEKSKEKALDSFEKRTSYLVGVVEKAATASTEEMKRADEYDRQLSDAESALRTAEENKGKAEYLKKMVEKFGDFVTGNNIFLAGSVMGKVKDESIGQSLTVVANMSYRMANNLKTYDKGLADRYQTYGRKLEALGQALTNKAAPTPTASKIANAVKVAKAHKAAP
jgi:hypothetical protein